MGKLWKSLVSKFTMRRQYCLFVDQVNGKEVCVYRDYYGNEFLSQSRFGYRVRRFL